MGPAHLPLRLKVSKLSAPRGTVVRVTRVAGIDCGTNSLRLLIADVVDGALTDVLRTMDIVRLGQGVDRTGRLDPAALERTFAVVDRIAETCDLHGVERIRFVATSATRDAANREEFTAGVRARLGVEPEVISGAEEAQLSFRGATAVRGESAPVLVVDIGGGSTEMVLGEGGAALPHGISLDMGCVRIMERHLHSDPHSEAELAAARRDVRAFLDRAAAELNLGATRSLVGVAGTITSITAQALGLAAYDRDRINGAVLPIADVQRVCHWFMRATHAEKAALGHLHPGRVDVIGAGALIWSEILGRVQAEVAARGGELTHTVTSEHDILDGIALSAAG